MTPRHRSPVVNALAELGCHLLDAPTVTLPLTHTRALDKVRGAA